MTKTFNLYAERRNGTGNARLIEIEVTGQPNDLADLAGALAEKAIADMRDGDEYQLAPDWIAL